MTGETGGLLLLGTLGVWRSLVARFVRDEEAVGSNPATPTLRNTSSGLVLREEDQP